MSSIDVRWLERRLGSCDEEQSLTVTHGFSPNAVVRLYRRGCQVWWHEFSLS